MRNLLLRFVACLLVLCCLDGCWLWAMMETYQRELSLIIAPNFRVGPVLLFYPLYAFALTALVVQPSRTVVAAGLRGALLGATAYGTYDLTNRGTLEHYSLFLTCVDLAWGTFLSASAAMIVAAIFGARTER